VCEIVGDLSLPNSFQIKPISGMEAKYSECCPTLSMKTLMAKAYHNQLAPFILKVDIEGSELLVFDDADSWIDAWPILMNELHDWMLPRKASSSTVLRSIATHQRDVIIQGSTLVSLAKDFKHPSYHKC